MPMKGQWEKKDEVWIEMSDQNIKPRTIQSIEREKIAEYSKKRYHASRRRRQEVPKQKYHSNTKLKEELQQLSEAYPDITCLYSIGQTEQGRDIMVLKITTDVGTRELLKPQVKLIGGIHGDEVVGRELLVYLARVFCEQYNHDQVITELIQSIELHILPSLNVDGFVLKTRNNGNDKDLNRSFPDWAYLGRTDFNDRLDNRPAETVAIMNWMR